MRRVKVNGKFHHQKPKHTAWDLFKFRSYGPREIKQRLRNRRRDRIQKESRRRNRRKK